MTMGVAVAAWVLALVVLAVHSRGSSVRIGLSLAYAVNLSVIHLVAATLYIGGSYWYFDPEVVQEGFLVSLWGILSFTLGVIVLEPLVFRTFPSRTPVRRRPIVSKRDPAKVFLVVGATCYFVLLPVVGGVPTLSSIVSVGYYSMITSFSFKLWTSWMSGQKAAFRRWFLLALLLPILTVISQGFLGYGVFALLCTVCVVACFYTPRRKLLAFGAVAIYLALSVYVTYIRDRNRIREVVWGGESYGKRFGELTDSSRRFEWFDPFDRDHIFRIDVRLNQNNLVGTAIGFLQTSGNFAHGATLMDAAIAVIPRALWPSKPVVAGSGNLVSDYTGIRFSAMTSVGIGQVLEFYVNFGLAGVILGFLLLGCLIAAIDRRASAAIRDADFIRFATWLTPGLCLLQVGGSLVEVTGSAAAAIVVVQVAKRFLGRPVSDGPEAPFDAHVVRST